MRNVEDASRPMRQELVDLFFTLAEHHPDEIPLEHIYRATAQASASRLPKSLMAGSDTRLDATSGMSIGPEYMI